MVSYRRGTRGRDPHWITARYPGTCGKATTCDRKIRKGDRAFYYPATRTVLCESCGLDAEREFEAARWDEEFGSR